MWSAIKYVAGCYVADLTVRSFTRIACYVGALFVAWHQMPPMKDRSLAPMIPPGDGLVENPIIRVAVTPGLTGVSGHYITAGTSVYRLDEGPSGSVIGPITF